VNDPAAIASADGRVRLFDDVLRSLSLALDFDEGQKLFHAWRVALVAVRLGERLGLSDPEWLFFAGLLHDIGGMGLADHVLHTARGGFRDGAARDHSAEGARIVRPFSLLAPIAELIGDHHERFDGRGFPLGKSGEAISPGAYVIAAGDFLDVSLRGGDFQSRLKVASGLAKSLRGAAWPARIGDALAAIIDEEPGFLADLFDDEKLRQKMDAARFSPPGLERFSKVEILGQLLWVFARVIDAKHSFTLGHSYRVTRLARGIARAMGGRAVDDWDLVWAGLLHDVGMLGVPRAIARRDGALDAEEKRVVRRHTLDSEAIISSIEELRGLALPAAAHHERYDGSGFSRGLSGDQIPLLGRVLAYADFYDTLRSERPYRRALSHADTIELMRHQVGTAFDPHLADAALSALDAANAAWPWKDEGSDFRRFFDEDSPDMTAVLPREGRERVVGPQGRHGAVLLEIEPWVELALGPKSILQRGRAELADLLGTDPGPALAPALDADSARRLLAWLESEAREEDPPWATVLFARSGQPLEVVARRRGEGAPMLVRSAEDRLQTMKQLALFYRNFLSGAEAAFFTGRDGKVVEANRSFLDVYGYKLEELTGANPPIFKSCATSHCFFKLADEATRSPAGAWHGELDTFHKDGKPVPTLFTLVAVRDAAGVVLGYVGRAVDISERKRLEAELKRKNEELEALSRLKGDLVAITSHDLKSPLASLMSYAELVKRRIADNRLDEVPRYVDNMAQLGDRMLRLVHDILSLRKIESGTFKLELRSVKLGELLQRCAETHRPLAIEKGLGIEVSCSDPSAAAPLDADRLEQVFNNLLSNALRFSPQGATVELHGEAAADRLAITVSDRGPGIPESELALIFDRYYQVKRNQPGGVSARSFNVGLGLSIARSIVELHGGTLRARNRDGGGCTFLVELPARSLPPTVNRPLALLVDATGTLVERLAPALSDRARVERAADLESAARIAEREKPAIVFAYGPAMSPGINAWIDRLSGASGRRPLLVEVHDGEVADTGLADHALALPVLDVEILELVREVSGSP
jgi:PAS domain S-box-containing protein